MDFNEMINSNSKKKVVTKKAKKSAEIISVPKDVQEEIDNLIKAKMDKKEAESDIKMAEVTIIDHGIKMKDKKAYAGKFQKSYKLGTPDSHINFITANKWSFNEDDVDEIKNIIKGGLGNPDELIIEQKDVKLKAEVFKDPELQKKFAKLVGKKFPEFFETVISHYVASDFDEKVYDLGEGAVEDLKVYMKQSKPSLR